MQERALFVPDGDCWTPTELSRGPWDPASLHGGSVAALVAREMESLEAPVRMRFARITVELLRPVGFDALALDARVVRPGAKVSVVEVEVRRAGDGTKLVAARGLRIRESEVDFPDPDDDRAPDLPDHADVISSGQVAYHSHAVEHRLAEGVFGEAGPAFDWTRLLVPVVPGEDPTPWQRTVASADFGNGLSSVVPFDGSALFINPDLTVHLWREPVGQWIGLDASTRTSGTGIGLAESSLHDRSGRIGRGLQSLLLDRFD